MKAVGLIKKDAPQPKNADGKNAKGNGGKNADGGNAGSGQNPQE